MNQSTEPVEASRKGCSTLRYSICTLVTDRAEYAEMVRSFRAGGFDGPDCEYLYLDNSHGNKFDGFAGGNLFLRDAKGKFIILCHQDVVLLKDNRETLETRLAELEALDPHWALCGNGGGTSTGEAIVRVSDPHGDDQSRGTFPTRVTSLDENFIVVRAAANLAFSRDLSGYHLYGADLCIVADILGWSAWVIDFHLRHKSAGRYEPHFFEALRSTEAKYRRAFRRRWITTTCIRILLSGERLHHLVGRLLRR